MTHLLGLKYIWIDSLCIIQDDIEDWRHEGSKMSDIYSGAYITLAATSASKGDGGFYQEVSRHRYWTTKVHSISNHKIPGSTYDISVRERQACIDPAENLQDLPLMNRAWTLQERILSPRVVQFGKDLLYWECLDACVCESGATLRGEVPNLTNALFLETPGSSEMAQSANIWHIVVEEYSIRELTFGKDKLPALQGIAKRLQSERRCAYYAGLWEDTLCYDLLWGSELRKRGRSPEYRAPSWSWASAQGYIRWPPLSLMANHQVEVVIVMVETIPAGNDPLGEIASGKLILIGLCLTGMIQHSPIYEDIFEINDSRKTSWDSHFTVDDDHLFHNGQSLTAVLMASTSEYQFYLVLQPVGAKGRIFQRVGRLQIGPTEGARYKLFDHAVQERHDKGETWEGCLEYQELTII
jgi:hypothetical protein